MPARFLDLSASVKLKFTGPDAVRYVNGQVSNDVRRLLPGQCLPACVTNHKGKLEAVVFISLGPQGEIFVASDADLRDFLPARMEKYLIADDAVCEDVTEQFCLFHFLETAPSLPPGAWSVEISRLGRPGYDVWAPASLAGSIRPLGTEIHPEAAEADRIERGIPAWAKELSPDILPPEAGLQDYAIDYHKGCYIGQEVISRLRSVGQVNKRLARLVVLGTHVPEPGWRLFSTQEDGHKAEAGKITSACWHPELNKTFALAFVKRNFFSPNAQFSCGPDENLLPCVVAIRNP